MILVVLAALTLVAVAALVLAVYSGANLLRLAGGPGRTSAGAVVSLMLLPGNLPGADEALAGQLRNYRRAVLVLAACVCAVLFIGALLTIEAQN